MEKGSPEFVRVRKCISLDGDKFRKAKRLILCSIDDAAGFSDTDSTYIAAGEDDKQHHNLI